MAHCTRNQSAKSVDPEALFVHEVSPILEAKCMSCHGSDPSKIEGGLDLRDYQNMKRGGDSGKATIIPGNPDRSFILHAVRRESEQYAMPPKDGDQLNDFEIEVITTWIENGAPWPSAETTAILLEDSTWSYGDRMTIQTSGGLSAAWEQKKYQLENLWAYQPLQLPKVPEVKGFKSKHPIDLFLQSKRAELQIEASPASERSVWLRRATFDLTGLPPSSDEIMAFVNDKKTDAYERVIERLLSSPHYGEQWARHWLDVVRYADSGGFSNDYLRPNAWRYRDYVIRSFNEDKPYNQFVLEQLAGDEMNPSNTSYLVATGFLRMGPWEHTSMSVATETRQQYLDDVTNIVGEAFLSTPLSCAKCHDHKYDPIPTKDYYQIQAVFATTQFADRDAAFLLTEKASISHVEKDRFQDLLADADAQLQALTKKEEDAARAWFRNQGRQYLTKRKRRQLPDDQQPPRYLGLTEDDLGYRKMLQKRIPILKRYSSRYLPLAYSVYNGPNQVVNSRNIFELPTNPQGPIPSTYILEGGSVASPRDEVAPGVLSVLHANKLVAEAGEVLADAVIPQTVGQRRLAFAKWLTEPSNPLFVRSIVNRVWHYHFGQGISQSPNNFGATGDKPTHPELLDWLANYFITNNWSFKKLHILIMTSEAYQMSSQHPQQNQVDLLDPDNHLLSYFSPRRLEAQELKDAMLMVSGELNRQIGGLPVRPEINMEAALQPIHTMGSIAPAYQPSRTPEERNRRSIYAQKNRTLVDPDLQVFNQPGSDLSCEARHESTVTPQAFTLLNSRNTLLRSVALASRLTKQYNSHEERIVEAIQMIWCRSATEEEIIKSVLYVNEMQKYHSENKPVGPNFPVTVQREMFEEMTGKSFSYEERLDIYEDYVPDLQPDDVDAKTRALADLITVLFNTNEFVYVY